MNVKAFMVAAVAIAAVAMLGWCISITVSRSKHNASTSRLATASGTPTLNDVLIAGNSAGGIPIRNVSKLTLSGTDLVFDGTNLLFGGKKLMTSLTPRTLPPLQTLQSVLATSNDAKGKDIVGLNNVTVSSTASVPNDGKLSFSNVNITRDSQYNGWSKQSEPTLVFTLPNSGTGKSGVVWFTPTTNGPMLYDKDYGVALYPNK